MIKISTGTQNSLLAKLKTELDGGVIKIYGGAVPASPNDALGAAVLLCTVSLASTGSGINFDTAPVNGVLSKAPGEVWSGVNAASGTATFYRHVKTSDTGNADASAVRLQGIVGVVGADLNLSSTALVSGATQTIDFYSVAQPSV